MHQRRASQGDAWAAVELGEVEGARPEGAVEARSSRSAVPVVQLRRRAEEALLADLALVGARGQVGHGPGARRCPRPGAAGSSSCSWFPPWAACLQHAAADLVELDRFEQGAEIALAEALVALALDDLEEDRADHGLGEDLQQQPAALGRRAVDQDAVGAPAAPGPRRGPAGACRSARSRCRARSWNGTPLAAQRLDRRVDVVGAERDVLDALAVIGARDIPRSATCRR